MSLFERVRDQQLALIAARGPAPGHNISGPAARSETGMIATYNYTFPASASPQGILLRDYPGSPACDFDAVRRLNFHAGRYMVLAPRFRLYTEHTGGYTNYRHAKILDDLAIAHVPAAEAHPPQDIATFMPANWADYFPALPASANPSTHTAYFPAYVPRLAWYMNNWHQGTNNIWLHCMNLIEIGPVFSTAQLGRVVAPRVDDPRRFYCTPHPLTPGDYSTGRNVFASSGSSTPVFTIIKEPGKTKSTLVTLGQIAYSGGYFDFFHAGITNWAGYRNLSETRSMTQILNDLAYQTGDDPMAGSYSWPEIVKTVNLSDAPPLEQYVSSIGPNVGGVVVNEGRPVNAGKKKGAEYTVAPVGAGNAGVVIKEGRSV